MTQQFEASRAEVAQTMQNRAAFFWQTRELPHFVKLKLHPTSEPATLRATRGAP